MCIINRKNKFFKSLLATILLNNFDNLSILNALIENIFVFFIIIFKNNLKYNLK